MIITKDKLLILFILIIILFILGGSFLGQIMDHPMKIMNLQQLEELVYQNLMEKLDI